MNAQGTRTRIFTALVLVIVAVSLTAIGQGADAKRRRRGPKPFTVRYVTTLGTAAARSNTQVTATCPGRSFVLGGGAFFNGAATEGPLASSSPIPVSGTDLGRGFAARIHNFEQTPQDFAVTAICASGGNVNVVYVRQTVTVPAFKAGSISAQCPVGKSLTGGGAFFDAPDLGQLNSSSGYPSGGGATPIGWFASVNNDTEAPHELVVTAICLSGIDVRYVDGSATINARSTNIATVACPTGTKLLGGGASLAGAPVSTGYLSTSTPIGQPTRDAGFFAEASSAASGPTTLIVQAACAAAA